MKTWKKVLLYFVFILLSAVIWNILKSNGYGGALLTVLINVGIGFCIPTAIIRSRSSDPDDPVPDGDADTPDDPDQSAPAPTINYPPAPKKPRRGPWIFVTAAVALAACSGYLWYSRSQLQAEYSDLKKDYDKLWSVSDQVYDYAYNEGFEAGIEKGNQSRNNDASDVAYADGFSSGFDEGYSAGLSSNSLSIVEPGAVSMSSPRVSPYYPFEITYTAEPGASAYLVISKHGFSDVLNSAVETACIADSSGVIVWEIVAELYASRGYYDATVYSANGSCQCSFYVSNDATPTTLDDWNNHSGFFMWSKSTPLTDEATADLYQSIVSSQFLPSASTSTPSCRYVVNQNTWVFHDPACHNVNDVSPDNIWYYNGTRQHLIDVGYTPCQNCNP